MLLFLSMRSFGMEYPSGEFGSDVLALSPLGFFPTTHLLTGQEQNEKQSRP